MNAEKTATSVSAYFVADADRPWEPVAEGVKRKVMTYEPGLMIVNVMFDAGGIGAAHSHVHTQMSYVQSGTFEITIGDQTRTVRAGDTYYVPSEVWHGARCVAAGMLVDVFSPMREDLI